MCSAIFFLPDQLRNSYQSGYDGSRRIICASGLDSHYQTEPHILAGTANPTVAKRNMTLPGENGQNLVEWRFRKEQAQGKVNVFGRKLRVSQRQRVVMASRSSASLNGLSTRVCLGLTCSCSGGHLTLQPAFKPSDCS